MKIHFVGIGGIGVSALAQYYLTKGHQVSGSDLVSSEITEALRRKGAEISIGKHRAKNLPADANLVIYSQAAPKSNPELKKAASGIPTPIESLSYAEALGGLTKKYFTIAVSGTHGKSTTTSMIGLLLVKAGLEPTVILGTKLREFAPHQKNGGGSNCRVGNSKYLVIEADEHFASFLNYWPEIIILTNLEPDHLDYYKNFKNYVSAFKEFVSHLPKNGYLVANQDDPVVYSTFLKVTNKVVWYSLKSREKEKLRKILKIPGEHNVSNALAALNAARILKIPDKISFKALSEYQGSWRRFEIKKIKLTNSLKPKTCTLISDYAHHPTEIRATLQAVREKYLCPSKFPKRKIWLIYQPHQYQRTYYLFKDFVKVFGETQLDKIIITDIYDVAGREKKEIKKKVNSQKLVKAINKKKVIYLPKGEILDYLKGNLQTGSVVIIMGAGDIYQLSLKLSA